MAVLESLIHEIHRYIERRGGPYRDWYVGVAADVERVLFDEHRVNRDVDPWIYRDAGSADLARDVETYFVHTLGADGETGGGGHGSVFVYAYYKGPRTRP